VGISAIQAIVGGGRYLWMGVAGLSVAAPSPLAIDVSDPAWSRVDYMFRAMAGIWFALGLMFAYMVPSIEKHSAWFTLTCVGIFGMGVGRCLSSLSFPSAPGNSTGAMIAELVIPPVYILWQRLVAREAQRGADGRLPTGSS
jgi:Domain of unknown function (DUF4345)